MEADDATRNPEISLQTLDRNPDGFLSEIRRRTSACFPISQHSGFYFPPFVETNGPPFSPERETFCMLSCAIQTGWRYVVGGWIRNVFIKGAFVTSFYFPLFQHRGFYFPPSAWGRMDSRQRIVSNACKSLIS